MNIKKWEKYPVERLHTQFYKFFLGLNKIAPNMVARNETGCTSFFEGEYLIKDNKILDTS